MIAEVNFALSTLPTGTRVSISLHPCSRLSGASDSFAPYTVSPIFAVSGSDSTSSLAAFLAESMRVPSASASTIDDDASRISIALLPSEPSDGADVFVDVVENDEVPSHLSAKPTNSFSRALLGCVQAHFGQ